MVNDKPQKRSDSELWRLIETKIHNKDYLFLTHAKIRQADRLISDIDVLDILINRQGHNRKRNKQKDVYTPGHEDWNYCIEGHDHDNKKIRVIVSFNQLLMLIITVIRLK